MVAGSGSASARRPPGRLSVGSENDGATTGQGALVSAQAHTTPTVRGPEEGGSRGKHRFPRAARRFAGRLNAPRQALVETGPSGTPHVVNREQVALVREEWRVVDRWWTDEPVDRHYFEVVLEGGRNVCVYRDGEASCWFTQNA